MSLWTKDEVVTILRNAHEAVDEAEVPPDLRAAAFGAAVQALGSKQVSQPVPAGVSLPQLRRH